MTGATLDLPQIVVVGGQSSGKSSVLENLVGKDFLPRGSGIVTRRPLILQLTQVYGDTEWGEFTHKPNQRYSSFESIKSEIQTETDRIAGRNAGVVDKPILLKIFSPHVVNLTLVDLPGITRNPVGDQPANIEQMTVNMVKSYAEKANAIILAVHAANQDVATSDAIKLANQLDPAHSRTIGVLTKVDLMDKGTDATAILSGREVPLTHGWVPVLSRSQQDINRGKPISSSLVDEEQWFKQHSLYSPYAERSGTKFLALKCNRLLTNHIRQTLPELKSQISTQIKSVKAQLELYGEPAPKDAHGASTHLLSLISKFSQEFKKVMEGGGSLDIASNQLSGAARIRVILNETFKDRLSKIDALTNLTTQDIRIAVRNASGTKSALLVPDQAFEQLIKRQIAQFREPSTTTAELVYSELIQLITAMPCGELMRYRRLRERINEVASKSIRSRLKEANALIDTLITLEVGFINTEHPDFAGFRALNIQKEAESPYDSGASRARAGSGVSGGSWLSSMLFGKSDKSSSSSHQITTGSDGKKRMDIKLDDSMTDLERNQVNTIVALLDSYMKISQKSIQDMVIKVIMVKLINEVQNAIQTELTAALMNPAHFGELLREDDDIEMKRINAKQQLERLRAAKRTVQDAETSIVEDL